MLSWRNGGSAKFMLFFFSPSVLRGVEVTRLLQKLYLGKFLMSKTIYTKKNKGSKRK